jgi:phospholipase/carboxylesterase
MRVRREKEHDVTPELTTLVVLHGYDSSAKKADELARELDPNGRWHHVSPDGPVTLSDGERAWFEVDVAGSVRAAVETVRQVVRSLTDDIGVDPASIALVGYSQGAAAAVATLATLGSSPSRVGRLLSINGFVVDEAGLDYDWTQLRGTRVLLQHGEQDDVVPSFFSSDLANVLGDAAVDVVHQSFPMGHERTAASIEAARSWLEGSE